MIMRLKSLKALLKYNKKRGSTFFKLTLFSTLPIEASLTIIHEFQNFRLEQKKFKF